MEESIGGNDMREIRFRAWDKKEKKMYRVYGLDFDPKLEVKLTNDPTIDIKSYKRVLWNDIELMQFTGLKDKNGREIYEGDVVGCADSDYSAIGLGEIVWNQNGYFEIDYHNGNRNFIPKEELHEIYGFEVIGNIYENPELVDSQNQEEMI